MRAREQFNLWAVDPSDLVDLTPAAARDLIIECFFHAQRATFARSRDQMGLESNPEKVHATIVGAVRAVFKESAGSFEAPTRSALLEVAETLGRKAVSWGTPEDIVQHHQAQADRILAALR